LSNGTVYYYTISNVNGGAPGPFQTCLTTTTPPTLAGQDCTTAAILCNSTCIFPGTSSNAGYGTQELCTLLPCIWRRVNQNGLSLLRDVPALWNL
jgi:hypothetical protein